MDFELRAKVPETDRKTIEAELNRLLRERRFSAAPQLTAFLRYIVTETLEGRGERIKAYTVGVDALGKPDTFDAQNDPSVRVLALRLRKALAALYESNDQCHTYVELKVGSYRPEFFKTTNNAVLGGNTDFNAKHAEAMPVTGASENSPPSIRQEHRVNMFHENNTVDEAVTTNKDSPISRCGSAQGLFSYSRLFLAVPILVAAAWLVSLSGEKGVVGEDVGLPTAYALALTSIQAITALQPGAPT